MAPPPLQTVNQSPRSSVMGENLNSPHVQPTPPSQHSSPSTTRSPGFGLQAVASPNSDIQPRQGYTQRQLQQMQQFQQQRAHNRSMSANTVGQPYPRRSIHMPVSHNQANYYPTSFQKHYDQLGKSTPTLPFQILIGSFVRPRLIPLVQTRSMTHTLICLMIQTAKTWILTASYPTFDYLLNKAMQVWQCKPHHQLQLRLLAMLEAAICPRYLSTMTQCLMPIRLDSVQACTSQIHMLGCNPEDESQARSQDSVFLSSDFEMINDDPRQASDGVKWGLASKKRLFQARPRTMAERRRSGSIRRLVIDRLYSEHDQCMITIVTFRLRSR